MGKEFNPYFSQILSESGQDGALDLPSIGPIESKDNVTDCPDSPRACKKSGFNWGPGLFLIIYHTALVCILPIYLYFFTPSISLILISILLYFISGISITGGYHRFYSHRSYKASSIVELFILFFATLTGQGSALRWSFDHRLHHAYTDSDRDPYSIKKGFWYAHMFWLFDKPNPIDPKVVPDLLQNRWVISQDRYYKSLFVLSNLFVFLAVGWILNDFIGAFVFSWWVRLFALHHSTWLINSLAHTWGHKPFGKELSAVNNYLLSFFTFGEGYHNYHHAFANDYRNGIRWYHFDPTKWFIWCLNQLGLATDLKRVNSHTINKRIVLEDKTLLLSKLKDLWYVKKDELENKIHELSEQLIAKISQCNHLKTKYDQFKKDCVEKAALMQLREELKKLQNSLLDDWRLWKQICKNILKLKPLKT